MKIGSIAVDLGENCHQIPRRCAEKMGMIMKKKNTLTSLIRQIMHRELPRQKTPAIFVHVFFEVASISNALQDCIRTYQKDRSRCKYYTAKCITAIHSEIDDIN